MKVYIALPVSGRNYDDVVKEIFSKKAFLEEAGYTVLHPLAGKGYLRTETKFKAEGYFMPPSTNHAIVERDEWMVRNCDIVFMDFSSASSVSIGCVMELAWAKVFSKYAVIVLPESNPHRHAFILEAADIVFETTEDALDYLLLLGGGLMEH